MQNWASSFQTADTRSSGVWVVAGSQACRGAGHKQGSQRSDSCVWRMCIEQNIRRCRVQSLSMSRLMSSNRWFAKSKIMTVLENQKVENQIIKTEWTRPTGHEAPAYSSTICQHHLSALFISNIHEQHSSASFISIIHQHHSSPSFIRIINQHHSSASFISISIIHQH